MYESCESEMRSIYIPIPQTERLEGSFSEENQEVLPELGRMNK